MRVVKGTMIDILLIERDNRFYKSGPLKWEVGPGFTFRSLDSDNKKQQHYMGFTDIDGVEDKDITKSDIKRFFEEISEEEAMELLVGDL